MNVTDTKEQARTAADAIKIEVNRLIEEYHLNPVFTQVPLQKAVEYGAKAKADEILAIVESIKIPEVKCFAQSDWAWNDAVEAVVERLKA